MSGKEEELENVHPKHTHTPLGHHYAKIQRALKIFFLFLSQLQHAHVIIISPLTESQRKLWFPQSK